MSNIEQPEDKESVLYLYRKIFPYLKLHYKLSIPLAIITLLMVVYASIMPLLTKALFDNALANKDLHLFFILITILIVGLVLLIAMWVATDILQAVLGTKICNQLRLEIFKKIHELSHKNYRENNPGNLLSTFENFSMLDYVLTQIFWGAIANIIFIIISATIMIRLNWQMSLILFFMMALTFYLVNKITTKAASKTTAIHQGSAQILHIAREEIDYHAIIPILSIQKYRTNQFNKKMSSFEGDKTLYSILLLLTNTAIAAGIVALQLLIIALGSYWVFIGKLTIGAFIAFLTIYSTFSYAINTLGEFYPALIRTSHFLALIYRVLDFPTRANKECNLPKMSQLSQSIRFNQVSFGYKEDNLILKDLNFEIRAGEQVAIIGASGAGKSTLLDLLLRQENPSTGTIEFDGQDIWEYSKDSLFSQIGIVPSQPSLFLMSIEDNIRLGKLDATIEEIIEAAKDAEIHEEIMALPDTYKTLVVWGGANLSTGQMQRIVLARALVGNPDILILDEATSALDSYNQDAINTTLAKQSENRTTVIITHHLNEVMHADKIIFLEKGEIKEVGTHKELIKAKGKYWQLWKKQTSIRISQDRSKFGIKLGWMRQIELFKILKSDLLESIIEKFMIEEVPPNQTIVEQNALNKKFYIIVKGRVQVSKKDLLGQDKVLATLEDGDFFGEIALIYTLPRTATVTTIDSCSFLVLHQEQFIAVIEKLPDDIKEHIYAIAKERLDNSLA